MGAELGPGAELAGHRILELIGRGGMSVVYLAEHVRLDRKVALKILSPELAEDDVFRERFIRESRVAAGLDHPNIVTVYDAGEAQGALYISMRYVPGRDLGQLLKEKGRLEPAPAVDILSQVAGALDAAHAEGLVHRDVKPGNILLARAPGAPVERAFLADFGVTKRVDSMEGLTRTGHFVGTVDYVAPEQIVGDPVDARTDVYSLGCVLFECFTGEVPYPGDSEVATIYSHLNDRIPPVAAGSLRTPDLDRVIARALAKSKEERFDSCSDLIEAALEELEAQGVLAPAEVTPRRGPSVGGRGARRASRRRRVTGAAVMVLLAALVSAATVWTLSRRAADEPLPPDPPPQTTGEPTVTGVPQVRWFEVPAEAGQFRGAGDQVMLRAIVVDGAVVVVGHSWSGADDDAAVWLSPNGQKWRRTAKEALDAPGDQRMSSVVELDGTLFAVGSDQSPEGDADAAVWTSANDGRAWKEVEVPQLGQPGDQSMRRVIVLGGELLAVGFDSRGGDRDAAVWMSSDGERWRQMDDPDLRATGQQEIVAVDRIDGRVLAVGYSTIAGDWNPAVWSLNGNDWRRVEDPDLEEPGVQSMCCLVAGGPGVIGVGFAETPAGDNDAAVWTSTNGRNWKRLSQDSFGGPRDQQMQSATRLGTGLVALGRSEGADGDVDGAMWRSQDGLEWSRVRTTAVAGLGGDDDQGIRMVMPYHRHGVALIAVGVERRQLADDGDVWIGQG
jgi:tRNA A-37 threonylcarbamoyl transferase component Bud32